VGLLQNASRPPLNSKPLGVKSYAELSMHLESKRLVYERITRNHARELERVLCDPRVYVHVDDGVAPTFDQLLESFALREIGSSGNRSSETWVDYIVRTRDSQVAIGRVEATIIEHRAEVAYILGCDHWGRGYGSESLVWLQHFLQKNYGVREFWATVTPGNQSSKHLLLKNGYVDVPSDNLPQLTSYDENDWVFFRAVEEVRSNA
jgi:[ribosomal protein S5]-alanine N-acetyltransferase